MRNHVKRIIAVGLLLGVAFSLSACGGQVRAEAGSDRIVTTDQPGCAPAKTALIIDKSKSAPNTRTPDVRLDDLDPLIDLLATCGGELAVGSIHDRLTDSFARLRLEPAPRGSENPKARNRLRRRREEARLRRAYEELDAQWEADMAPRMQAFVERVEPLLAHPMDANWSPVWETVWRADLFLGEEETGWGRSARRVLLLVSDAIDDVPTRPVARDGRPRGLRSGATVLLVNGAGQVGSLASLEPARFESFDAALRYLETLIAGNATPSANKQEQVASSAVQHR